MSHNSIVPEEADRVVDLLEEKGGEMKQQEVVRELDWSDAKTSQYIDYLDNEGKLEYCEIGRQNFLYSPENVPAIMKS